MENRGISMKSEELTEGAELLSGQGMEGREEAKLCLEAKLS